ncbi:FAD-dependent oxidoreductase [Streptomyces sp. NPDC002018]|uniref:FAD-dependent oxidoreductase n=1 Tax=Streptomyces sp. NPDC002018 TaxID=3364629 RepID=UPI0036B7DE6F
MADGWMLADLELLAPDPATDAALSAAAAPVLTDTPNRESVSITPNDPRYQDLLLRGYNRRFTGSPDNIRVVTGTGQVIDAVNDAVREGKQIGVRGGGHNLDGLVDDPRVRSVIDMTGMRAISYDPVMRAFSIEAGATLGEVYRTLYYGWGVTLPGGACPPVGVGGHITGGGYGALSRQYGLVADNLYAVEVVVVPARGSARAVVATREPGDPNRDLWWAHSGGGGGNFGVVTRFWLRSPNARTNDPGRILPKAPGGTLVSRAVWSWNELDRNTFVRIARNIGVWHERHSAPGMKENALYGGFIAPRSELGTVTVAGQIDPTVEGNEQILQDYIEAACENVGVKPTIITSARLPWLTTIMSYVDTGIGLGAKAPLRSKTKGAYLRRRYTDSQMETVHAYLTGPDYHHGPAAFALSSYGGQINALAPDATATSHRRAVLLGAIYSYWDKAEDDARHLTWQRDFYRDLHQNAGGVPAPGDQYDGCYIGWPDVDLADPALNTSRTTWQTLFYADNYARLKKIKKVWDPRGVFRHALSV